MDLRQLRTFAHIAELGSVTAAAGRLHIAQPALTRQIQSLEADVKARLFRRNGRGMELTDEGQRLLERATVILREVDQARAELRTEAELLGEVSFGVPPTVADVLSGPLIERFLRSHPKVKLKISAGYSGYVLDWLQRGLIDMGVLYETKTSSTIRIRPLILESLFLVEAKEKGRSTAPITLREVGNLRLVLPTRQHGLRLLVDRFASQNGVTIDPVIETDSLPLQIDLVRRKLGATILPLVSVYGERKAGRLAIRPIVKPEITRRLVLATALGRRTLPAALNQFEKAVVDEIAELARTKRWQGILQHASSG